MAFIKEILFNHGLIFVFWWNEDEIVSSVSCSNLIAIYFLLFFIKLRGRGRRAGGREGPSSNCLFSSKMSFWQVPALWSDKIVKPRHKRGNKKDKQIYLNIKHSCRLLEEFLDFDHLFSNIFDLFESKMKMNQSKYWQEKVTDSNFTNEKFSLPVPRDYKI